MKKILIALLAIVTFNFSYSAEIINQKENFNKFWTEAKGKDLDTQQKLFAKYIESVDPTFYKENVWGSTYSDTWQEERLETIKEIVGVYDKVGIKKIDETYDLYEKTAKDVFKLYEKRVPDYNSDIIVMLTPAITWGGSYMPGTNHEYLGMGIDRYLMTPTILVEPLMIHETFHHYHFQTRTKRHPDFKISDEVYTKEGKLFWQLWDEGMAMWGTAYVANNFDPNYALMSDDPNRYNISKAQLQRYAKLFLEEIDNPAIDRKNPINVKKWFGARVKDNPLGKDTPPMIGYYMGFLVIKRINESGISREEFMGWNYEEARPYIVKELKKMIK